MKGIGRTMTRDNCSRKRASSRSAASVCIKLQRRRNCLPAHERALVTDKAWRREAVRFKTQDEVHGRGEGGDARADEQGTRGGGGGGRRPTSRTAGSTREMTGLSLSLRMLRRMTASGRRGWRDPARGASTSRKLLAPRRRACSLMPDCLPESQAQERPKLTRGTIEGDTWEAASRQDTGEHLESEASFQRTEHHRQPGQPKRARNGQEKHQDWKG